MMNVRESGTPRIPSSFFVMWTGQAVSMFGSRLVQFALIWWLTLETGSATVLATATLAGLLPQVVVGVFSGTVVDRESRKVLMMLSDSLVALAAAVLCVLFLMELVQIWHIYTILIVRALTETLQRPALIASTALMVPKGKLARVQGMNQMLEGGLTIVTAPLAALLLSVVAVEGILLVDVVTAIMAVASLAFIYVPQPAATKEPPTPTPQAASTSYWREVKAGFRYVLGWPGLFLLLMLATLVNFLLNPGFAMLPLLVSQHFQGGAQELGWMEATVGVGIVSGGLLLGLWGGFERRIVTSLLGVGLLGFNLALLGGLPGDRFNLALGAVFMAGTAVSLTNGPIQALFQSIVAPEMQGRFSGVASSMSMAASPLGLLVAGPFADRFGVRAWMMGAGALVVLACLVSLFLPALRSLEDGDGSAGVKDLVPGATLEADELRPVSRMT